MAASAGERCSATDTSGLALNFEDQVISVVRLFKISGENAAREIQRRIDSDQGLTVQGHKLGIDVLEEAMRRWREETSQTGAEGAGEAAKHENNGAAPCPSQQQPEPAADPTSLRRQNLTPSSATSDMASLASRGDQVASVMRLLRIHGGNAVGEIQRRIDSQEALNIQGVTLEPSVLQEALQVWFDAGGSVTQKPYGAVTKEAKEGSAFVKNSNAMDFGSSASPVEEDNDPWPSFAAVLESKRPTDGGCAPVPSANAAVGKKNTNAKIDASRLKPSAQENLTANSSSGKNSNKPNEDLSTEGNQVASVARLLRIHGENAAQEIERRINQNQPVCVQGINIRPAVLESALTKWRWGRGKAGDDQDGDTLQDNMCRRPRDSNAPQHHLLQR